MAAHTEDEIIGAVKTCVDEIALNDANFVEEQDDVEMDKIIKSKIHDAYRFVLTHADWSLIDPDTSITEVSVGADLIGSVRLPDNFVRLCSARFQSWPLYISRPVYWDDKEFATLADPYAGGTWERPKVGMVLDPWKTLKLYRAKDTSDTAEIRIVTDNYTEGSGVDIPDALYPSFIYYVSGLTLLTYKDEHADSMFNQALVLMGVSPSTKQE